MNKTAPIGWEGKKDWGTARLRSASPPPSFSSCPVGAGGAGRREPHARPSLWPCPGVGEGPTEPSTPPLRSRSQTGGEKMINKKETGKGRRWGKEVMLFLTSLVVPGSLLSREVPTRFTNRNRGWGCRGGRRGLGDRSRFSQH